MAVVITKKRIEFATIDIAASFRRDSPENAARRKNGVAGSFWMKTDGDLNWVPDRSGLPIIIVKQPMVMRKNEYGDYVAVLANGKGNAKLEDMLPKSEKIMQ